MGFDPVFSGLVVPTSATLRVNAPYTSTLGNLSIACAMAFTVTSP